MKNGMYMFKPNTLEYRTKNKALAKKKLGIIVHTEYKLEDELLVPHQVQDISCLQQSDNMWVDDVRLDMSQIDIPHEFDTAYTNLATKVSTMPVVPDLMCENIARFINSRVRDDVYDIIITADDYIAWTIKDRHKRRLKFKTPKRQDRFDVETRGIEFCLEEDYDSIDELFDVYYDMINLKLMIHNMLIKLDKYDTYVTDKGKTRPTQPEGFVTGNMIKIVNRIEFSRLNFLRYNNGKS